MKSYTVTLNRANKYREILKQELSERRGRFEICGQIIVDGYTSVSDLITIVDDMIGKSNEELDAVMELHDDIFRLEIAILEGNKEYDVDRILKEITAQRQKLNILERIINGVQGAWDVVRIGSSKSQEIVPSDGIAERLSIVHAAVRQRNDASENPTHSDIVVAKYFDDKDIEEMIKETRQKLTALEDAKIEKNSNKITIELSDNAVDILGL